MSALEFSRKKAEHDRHTRTHGVYPPYCNGVSWLVRWGILLWYVTLGAIIGAFGFYTQHPVLKFPMPWWLRDPLMGAWMNFVLVLFAYDAFAAILKTIFGSQSIMTSPFWFVLEGAIVGFVIGYFAKRFGGEGPDVLAR